MTECADISPNLHIRFIFNYGNVKISIEYKECEREELI